MFSLRSKQRREPRLGLLHLLASRLEPLAIRREARLGLRDRALEALAQAVLAVTRRRRGPRVAARCGKR